MATLLLPTRGRASVAGYDVELEASRSLADRRGSAHPQGCWKIRWVKFAIKGYNPEQSRIPTTGNFLL